MSCQIAPSPIIVRNEHLSSSPSSVSVDKESLHTCQSSFADDDNSDDYYELPSNVADELCKRTEALVSRAISHSKLLDTSHLQELPRFNRSELDIGCMIGQGGFSDVREIVSFKSLEDNALKTKGNNSDDKKRRYIVKNLNPRLALYPIKLQIGAKDLVMEAHFLSSLNHKNIIQLRGWSSAGVAAFSEMGRADALFLVYDRLQETLCERIRSWRDRSRQIRRSSSFLSKKRQIAVQQKHDLFIERLQVAIQVAEAVEYLHSKRVIYRDLKPANIGFDDEGTVKLFDFGLAVEVPEKPYADATFNLSGNTGTSRYMAVEVILKEFYNFKADVFSFSVLLCEVMSLCKPFDGLDGDQVKEWVAVFGERPHIPRSLPNALRQVIKQGWAEFSRQRPTISQVRKTLERVYEASISKSNKMITKGDKKNKFLSNFF